VAEKTDIDALEEVLKTVQRPERILCLGLGSLEDDSRRISFVQLALLMEIRTRLKVLFLP
jgi:hypothetical protein